MTAGGIDSRSAGQGAAEESHDACIGFASTCQLTAGLAIYLHGVRTNERYYICRNLGASASLGDPEITAPALVSHGSFAHLCDAE